MATEAISCAVHVTPKAGRDQVVGVLVGDDGAAEVSVRVTAPPEDGKANKAVCKVVAASLGIAKGAVSVRRGETSRHKILQVECDPAVYAAWYEALPRA